MRNRDDVDAVAAESAEEPAGDAGGPPHVLTDDGHDGKTVFNENRFDLLVANLMLHFLFDQTLRHLCACRLDREADRIFRRCLGDEKDVNIPRRQRPKDAPPDSRESGHAAPLDTEEGNFIHR